MKTRCLSAIIALLCGSFLLADDRREELAVFEATLRQQISEHLDDSDRARQTVVCLGINPGQAPQSPNKEFMARFRREPAVRCLTECEARPSGAVEGTTLRPAVIVTAGPIEWRAEDEAWVTVAYFRSRSQSALRKYRVVRELRGWVSIGQVITDAPA